jgi:hypothetical protein
VTQGGDIAFIYGTLKVLFEKGGSNAIGCRENDRMGGLAARTKLLDWGELERGSGLSRQAMEEFATLLHDAAKAS